jgi:hypothetical protein
MEPTSKQQVTAWMMKAGHGVSKYHASSRIRGWGTVSTGFTASNGSTPGTVIIEHTTSSNGIRTSEQRAANEARYIAQYLQSLEAAGFIAELINGQYGQRILVKGFNDPRKVAKTTPKAPAAQPEPKTETPSPTRPPVQVAQADGTIKVGSKVTVVRGHNSVKGRTGTVQSIVGNTATVQMDHGGGRSITAPIGSLGLQ